MPLDLTDEERAAVLALLTKVPLEKEDLYSALARSYDIRLANSRNGGLAITALNRNGESWRDIAHRLSELLGREVPVSTIRGWIDPPKKARP